MDIEVRKYNFIRELITIDSENILDALEKVLKREKEVQQQIDPATKDLLEERMESYKNNPDDVLDWEDVKANW